MINSQYIFYYKITKIKENTVKYQCLLRTRKAECLLMPNCFDSLSVSQTKVF